MANQHNFKSYVISLRRTPERMEEFVRRNGAIVPEVSVFEAFDGKSIVRADAVKSGIISEAARTYSPGAIGGAMSHRALWQRCVDEKRPLLILEDDAVLRRDFQARVSDLVEHLDDRWDIIRLGYNFDSILDIRMTEFCNLQGSFSINGPSRRQLDEFVDSSDPVHLFRLNNAFGICAYLISPKGARILLKRCFPLESRMIDVPALRRKVLAQGTDYIMNAHYREMHAYLCFGPLVMVANDHAVSTIQAPTTNRIPGLLARGGGSPQLRR